MCPLKEFGVRALLCDLGATDPCASAIARKWFNDGADRAQVRRATVMESSFSRDHRWVAFGASDASGKVLDPRNADSSEPERFSGHSAPGAVRSRRNRVPHRRADSSLIRRSPTLSETHKLDICFDRP